jgi:phage gp36-like protein
MSGAEAVASYWLGYAEAEVDARLAVKYTVPFSPAPPLVKDLAIDLTYFRMTIRQKGSELIKEFIDERFAGLIGGTITLTDSSGAAMGGISTAWSEQDKSGYHTTFGPDSELNWTVSSAWRQDVQDERGQP